MRPSLRALVPLGLSALVLPALPALTGPATAVPTADPGPPNVVLVMADDLGWADLHSGRTAAGHGNPYVDTPALDRLAET